MFGFDGTWGEPKISISKNILNPTKIVHGTSPVAWDEERQNKFNCKHIEHRIQKTLFCVFDASCISVKKMRRKSPSSNFNRIVLLRITFGAVIIIFHFVLLSWAQDKYVQHILWIRIRILIKRIFSLAAGASFSGLQRRASFYLITI